MIVVVGSLSENKENKRRVTSEEVWPPATTPLVLLVL
jgi:hypothetical protein